MRATKWKAQHRMPSMREARRLTSSLSSAETRSKESLEDRLDCISKTLSEPDVHLSRFFAPGTPRVRLVALVAHLLAIGVEVEHLEGGRFFLILPLSKIRLLRSCGERHAGCAMASSSSYWQGACTKTRAVHAQGRSIVLSHTWYRVECAQALQRSDIAAERTGTRASPRCWTSMTAS
jgi:hypothetical protein